MTIRFSLILDGRTSQHTDHRHLRLLGLCTERPTKCCATNEYNKPSSLHSMTSSAVARSVCGTLRLKVLAVLRLIARLYLPGN